MKLRYIVILASLIISCKSEFDRTEINSVAMMTIKKINERDSKHFNEMLSLGNSEDDFKTRIYDAGIKNLERNLYSESVIKVLTHEVKNSKLDLFNEGPSPEMIQLFIQTSDDIYQLDIQTNIKDSIISFSSLNLKNLSLECLKSKNQKYAPTNVVFNNAYWLTSRDKKSFKEFNLKGYNKSNLNISEIRFRLTMKRRSGSTFMSKTIRRNLSIEAGDTFEIIVDELNNYFVGFELSKETFSFSTEIISTLPKPYDVNCDLVQLLKQTAQ